MSSGAVIVAFTFLFGVALYPNLVVSTLAPENNLTVWRAASSEGTLVNLLIAAGIGMPFVLTYTIITYRVFRKPGRPGPNEEDQDGSPGRAASQTRASSGSFFPGRAGSPPRSAK